MCWPFRICRGQDMIRQHAGDVSIALPEGSRVAPNATCSVCGWWRPVCHNYAYVLGDDGIYEHVKPLCKSCCDARCEASQ